MIVVIRQPGFEPLEGVELGLSLTYPPKYFWHLTVGDEEIRTHVCGSCADH